MALTLGDWNSFSARQQASVINFLKENCKIDDETPASQPQQHPNTYPITDGITRGGNPMKYGRELRIYIKDMTNCPLFFKSYCVSGTPSYSARLGGNDAIEAIMQLGNFTIGSN